MTEKTNWRNAELNSLPNHGQKVLLSIDGINYFAVYNTDEMGFELKVDPKRIVSVTDRTVHWMELNLK